MRDGVEGQWVRGDGWVTLAMTRSLALPNFRRYFCGGVVANIGTWMLRTGQSWLVLHLGNGSGVALGIVTFLQFGPTIVLSPISGALSDRYDKATTLTITQSLIAISSLGLALLDFAGAASLPWVYGVALVGGVITAIDAPIRTSFVTELVGPHHVVNAIGLNSASFNGARLVGPLLAACVISVGGTAWAFLVSGISGAAIVHSLIAIDRADLHLHERGSNNGGWTAGFSGVFKDPLILSFSLLAMLANAAGANSLQVVLPIIATEVFSGDVLGFGFLTAAMAVGGVCGALAASSTVGTPRVRWVLGTAEAFAVLVVISSAMPTYLTFAASLVLVGLCYMTFIVMVNTVIQLAAPPTIRGRVVAVYLMFFLGGGALGSPLLGALSDGVGPMRAMTVAGSAVGITALVIGVILRVLAKAGPVVVDHWAPVTEDSMAEPRGGDRDHDLQGDASQGGARRGPESEHESVGGPGCTSLS